MTRYRELFDRSQDSEASLERVASATMSSKPELLSVRNLRVFYEREGNVLRAVDGISLDVHAGEVVALVGESGSGKTTAALTIARLLPPNARIESGEVLFEDRDLLRMNDSELARFRGKQASMIFQEPVSYLNPLMKAGDQIAEAIMLHDRLEKKAAQSNAVQVLKRIRIPDPERVYHYYPHQLSGGMAQRVSIAIAISCHPQLLIADEPTSNLDLTVQSQILHLLKVLNRELGLAILLISHDLGVVSGLADKVIVMYAGQIAEEANVNSVYHEAKHPYTQTLLAASRLAAGATGGKIVGGSPDPANFPQGCRFHPRCSFAMSKCISAEPPEFFPEKAGRVKCWLYGEHDNA